MSSNFYQTLGVNKSATTDEIKKAYRKQAMKYHPDRNKGDKSAETKFKELNEAYGTLSDPQKKQQYDTFGSTWGNPFGGAGWSWYSHAGSGGFEDMFSQFWWAGQDTGWANFNFEDLFWGWWGFWWNTQRKSRERQEPVSLDFEKTYEVPIFDLILWCKIEVKGVYGKIVKLKIPPSTKPWVKFRVKDLGKSEGTKKWNLIVKIEAVMPKNISEVDMSMLERIRENIGY